MKVIESKFICCREHKLNERITVELYVTGSDMKAIKLFYRRMITYLNKDKSLVYKLALLEAMKVKDYNIFDDNSGFNDYGSSYIEDKINMLCHAKKGNIKFNYLFTKLLPKGYGDKQ